VERIMSLDAGGGNVAKDAPQIECSTRLLQHAIDRWLARITLSSKAEGAIASDVRHYAGITGWVIPDTLISDENNDGDHLIWLLDQAEKADQKILTNAIHRAIQLLSFEDSLQDAVERAARRQVYNLAYGLTHEINNPLANMVARAQRLLVQTTDPGNRKSLSTIMDQGMRAHEMLAEVMRAVQPTLLALTTTDVSYVIKQVCESLQTQAAARGIAWTYRSSNEKLYAAAHASSLLDAFRMLGLNALEVCGPNDAIDWSCDLLPKSSDSSCVRITIRDTGPGLSAEAQRSAWDLYFSGREHGRGLGISLAVVKRIIEQHHGTIALRSESGAGCSVEIELPAVDAPAAERPKLTW
jgi:signal transduction histidine kinase